jgi:hypothetical protein
VADMMLANEFIYIQQFSIQLSRVNILGHDMTYRLILFHGTSICPLKVLNQQKMKVIKIREPE